MTLDQFTESLKSDQIWWEQVEMRNKHKDIPGTIEKLYMMSLADQDLFSRPIQEQRKHLFNMLWKAEPVKKNWIQTHQVEEKKEDKPFVPASDEHIAKCVAEFNKILEESPNWHISRVKPSKRLEEELGEVRVRSTHFQISDVDMRLQAMDNVRRLQNHRRRAFIEAYPDAQADEIEAYVQKWAHIDNPDNLPV